MSPEFCETAYRLMRRSCFGNGLALYFGVRDEFHRSFLLNLTVFRAPASTCLVSVESFSQVMVNSVFCLRFYDFGILRAQHKLGHSAAVLPPKVTYICVTFSQKLTRKMLKMLPAWDFCRWKQRAPVHYFTIYSLHPFPFPIMPIKCLPTTLTIL